ncbi:hypothetical protein EVAR_66619_1 [Eumeta japonica]|uniref:Uncharacterized protein n=1 Tax=Eumeta variegata TaxID=151549 RepID=A0A4C2A7E6_EUMVA|nr:hypothetical protein EVAR_66619_1 [Eumeta japonica]
MAVTSSTRLKLKWFWQAGRRRGQRARARARAGARRLHGLITAHRRARRLSIPNEMEPMRRELREKPPTTCTSDCCTRRSGEDSSIEALNIGSYVVNLIAVLQNPTEKTQRRQKKKGTPLIARALQSRTVAFEWCTTGNEISKLPFGPGDKSDRLSRQNGAARCRRLIRSPGDPHSFQARPQS